MSRSSLQAEEDGIQHQNPQYAIAERTANYLRQHYKEPVSYQRLSDAMHFHQNYLSICMKNVRLHAPGISNAASDRTSQAIIDPHQRFDRTHCRRIRIRFFPYFIRRFIRYTGFKPKSFRQKYRS